MTAKTERESLENIVSYIDFSGDPVFESALKKTDRTGRCGPCLQQLGLALD